MKPVKEPSEERRRQLKKMYKKIRMENRWYGFKYAIFSFVCRLFGHSKKRIHRMGGEHCKRCGHNVKPTGQVRLNIRL